MAAGWPQWRRRRMLGGIEMRRRTFDALMVFAGLALTAILLVAGGLLSWGHTFVNNEVHSQLAAKKFVSPPASSPAIKTLPATDAAAMRQYAGQTMTNGAQAQAYYEHFIAVHLSEIGGGLTYSQLSAKAMADPKNTKLADQVAAGFKGTTQGSVTHIPAGIRQSRARVRAIARLIRCKV